MNKSVLVVGAGIGGIQASLDLADSGFKVYLVEKTLSVGGTMAQLDKTFPTNDCSMCILSPKMVDVGRKINIDLLSNSEVLAVDGKAGDFKVKIRKLPRYVSFEDCKGCGDCADACPVELPNPYEENIGLRSAIWRPFDQAVPSTFGIEKLGIPPCRARCPIHLNAYGYVMAAKKGEWNKAQELVRKDRNFIFAASAARVCTHPCEGSCSRKEVDESVSIRGIKRFVTDWEFENFGDPSIDLDIKEEKKEKIAIIGAGPAGLTSAFHLRKKGYKVVVYDAFPTGGGMLFAGIPPYRLPKDILKKEVDVVSKSGVEIKYNTKVGKDISFKEIVDDNDAIFVATGAHKSRSMRIKGEDLNGVFHAIDILTKINLKEEVNIGKKVIVVGGGNSAMDAARSVLRKGSDVTVIYRRSKNEMPAISEEVEAALDEGVKIEFLCNPIEFIGENGNLKKVKIIKMELGEPDDSGRRRPVPIEGSEKEIEVDNVLLAIGEQPDIDFLSEDIEKTAWNTIKTTDISLQTSNSKIFAGGDVVTGPSTFIEAVSHGMRAAESIDRYITGKDLLKDRESELPFESSLKGDFNRTVEIERMTEPEISVENRVNNFNEVVSHSDEKDVLNEANRCLECSSCSECMLCIDACEPKAIIHDMITEEIEIEVGSIILTPGFQDFNAEKNSELGYGRFENVITSTQFERIMCASGPFKGHIKRLSDKKEPKKIAWIQCVGSRDKNNPYCSSVCCMYATKEAVITKEHNKDFETTIFYMDLRSYGKDFDKYIERAKNEYGVRFIRSRISSITEDTETKDLHLKYEYDGKICKESFEMIVLSVGLSPPKDNKKIEEIFDIKLNEFGFAKTDPFLPLSTSRDGIYVAGAFQEPKDIPETVVQSSAAAGFAGGLLSDAEGETIKKIYPKEKNVKNEKPRIGVFICHCGINIGGYVDIKELVEYTKTLPNVIYTAENLYTCSQDTQEKIKEVIEKDNLNRIIVASCTPRTHEPLFQDTIKEAGLNPYLFELANIRDQCSWVHMHEPEKATEKAKDIVRMAVAKSNFMKPLETYTIPVTKKALIIGGGVTGMNAALGIANEGFESIIIEKDELLGGHARLLNYTINGENIPEYIERIIKQVENNPKIKIYTNSEIRNTEGYIGNFKTTISNNGEDIIVDHGVAIVAIGAKENTPIEYNYGEHPNIVTQLEFENILLSNNSLSLDGKRPSIVMIQCVGSRNDEHPYCSRFCCTEAIKNAILFKEKYPEIDVFVLYRDIRTYGYKETYYEKARELGVVFIHFEEDNPPSVSVDEKNISLTVFEPVVNKNLLIKPNYLVLSNGVIPNIEENEKIAKMFKVPINQDGFFLEAHVKLRPVDFATEGVFIAGLAHNPKRMDECIAQAYAAVSRATTILTKEGIETSGTISTIDSSKCAGCGLCIETCPYKAIDFVEKQIFGETKTVAEVNNALCKGCGACVSACRGNAIDLLGFTNEEIISAISALSEEKDKMKKGIQCGNCLECTEVGDV